MDLKAYYDGSGKPDDPNSQWLTLAGYAGSEGAWERVRENWLGCLSAETNPQCPRSKSGNPYFHSVEAFNLREGYAVKLGWNTLKVLSLARRLLNVLAPVERSDLIGFSTSIRLSDYRSVKEHEIPALRRPEAICVDGCIGTMLRHPFLHPVEPPTETIEPLPGLANIFFDKGDKFFGILNNAWKKKEHGERTWWASMVRSIEQVEDMRDDVGIQCADLLAWQMNRYHTLGPEDDWGLYTPSMFIVKAHYHTTFDRDGILAACNPDGSYRS